MYLSSKLRAFTLLECLVALLVIAGSVQVYQGLTTVLVSNVKQVRQQENQDWLLFVQQMEAELSSDVNWQGGGSFVYAELFPKNMGYLQDVIHAKNLDELKSVYERMLAGTDTTEPADISFRADLSKIDWMEGFDENKRLLVKLLDKNGLYYNYSEIDDKNVRDLISDEDYTFNKNFYEGGD